MLFDYLYILFCELSVQIFCVFKKSGFSLFSLRCRFFIYSGHKQRAYSSLSSIFQYLQIAAKCSDLIVALGGWGRGLVASSSLITRSGHYEGDFKDQDWSGSHKFCLHSVVGIQSRDNT